MAEGNTAITPDPGAAGDKGGSKKIAGKYDSPEQAIESLDRGFTKGFHDLSEKLGAVVQLLEGATRGSDATTEVGTRGREDQGYNRGTAEDESFDNVSFLSAPGKALKDRDKKLEERLTEKFNKRLANAVTNAAIVGRFQAKNSDLDEHEPLVTMFMQQTSPQDGLAKQLIEAGKLTRAYLKKLKAEGKEDGDAGRTTSNDEFEEGPAGQRTESKAGDEGKKVASPDEELAASIAEHRQFKSSRFAPIAKK